MKSMQAFVGATLCLAAAGLMGCAGGSPKAGSPSYGGKSSYGPASDYQASEQYAPAGEAPGASGYDGDAPPPPAAPQHAAPRAGADEARASSSPGEALETQPTPAPTKQPGLATSWGETLSSRVTSAPFQRADGSHPFAVSSIYYNDSEGVAAMTDLPSGARVPRSVFPVHDGFIEVGLRDGGGNFLTGFSARGDNFVTGRAGDRYTIFVRNHSPGTVEVVVSVDGLDVIDGKAAAFTKRGYLLASQGLVEIEGFRTSEQAVAAFRFGSVRESYASLKHGDTRNVGVIGVALFHQLGDDPSTWSTWRNEDVIRRQNANPFPAQYATPPGR